MINSEKDYFDMMDLSSTDSLRLKYADYLGGKHDNDEILLTDERQRSCCIAVSLNVVFF